MRYSAYTPIIAASVILAPIVGFVLRPAATDAPPDGPVLVVGGDVNLGRRQNRISAEAGPEAALLRVPDLGRADLAYVNLECVVSTTGDYRVDKGEHGPYYYRGRPEMLAVLKRAGIDVVGTANNHSGDYGPSALLEQRALLEAWGIAQTGTGEDVESACSPVVRHAGDLAVAFFAIDATKALYAARSERAGGCYLDPSDPEAWRKHLQPRISAVRDVADVVVVGVHWGANGKTEPAPGLLELGHAIVDAGADAVVGSSAHALQGVEVYEGRPILHDTGNLLFDAYDVERTPSAVFSLVLGPAGVRAVSATPVWVEYGSSRIAGSHGAESILGLLEERSRALGTNTWTTDERLWFDIPEPPDRPAPPHRAAADPPPPALEPAVPDVPPADCTAAEVPADARIEPVHVGPLVLVGFRAGPTRMARRGMVDFETWWTVDEPPEGNPLLEPAAQHLGSSHRWAGAHEGCDWAWPVSRWKPGVIWHDQYAMRPSQEARPGDYRLEIGVVEGKELLGVHEIGALHLERRR